MSAWMRIITVCTAVLIVGAGCAVDQEKEIATYRQVVDLQPAPQWADDGVLTLRESMLLANAGFEELNIEGESYLRALIERRRAVAGFLPTVDLVPRYTRRDPVSGSDGGSGGAGQDSAFDVPVDLQFNLFNGFRDVNRYWADTFRIAQRRHGLLSSQESLLLDVADVFYQVLRSEASVRVLESSLAVQEERLRDARGRVEARVGRALDVVQTEAQVSATRTTLINARRDVVNARNLLAFLVGEAEMTMPLERRHDTPADVPAIDDYLELARTHRHDLAAALAAVQAARRDVEVAWGQYYPSVDLDLTAFLYRETTPEARDWDALLSARIPLFAAGRIDADVREAWSLFREAVLLRQQFDRRLVQQVRRSYDDYIASGERLRELRVQVGAAEQAERLASEAARVGLGTNLDRIVAQDALLSAQLQLASEEFDREMLYLSLVRTIGLLREELNAEIAVDDQQLTTR